MLEELEAGGAFRSLCGRIGARELREIRRQREDWDREALHSLHHRLTVLDDEHMPNIVSQ